MNAIRVVVVLEGGLVQNVVADVALEVLVVDRDVEGAQDAPEVALVQDRLATVVPWEAPALSAVVDAYFSDALHAGLLP
jgi:hypothetical protein